MIEAIEDLFTFPADIVVITTNGVINTRGQAVMGRGTALQAVERYGPELRTRLADSIRLRGLHFYCVWIAPEPRKDLYAFPVKYHWREPANLDLIRSMAGEMAEHANAHKSLDYVMPKPGCGNGGLDWEKQVRPILRGILPDNVYVVDVG